MNKPPKKLKYAVVSVVERRTTLLPKTLYSLRTAGFIDPPVFVDGADRKPQIGGTQNWILSMMELYLRDSLADFYIIFEDDIIVSPGLRGYLENVQLPPGNNYYNLYTVPQNQKLANRTSNNDPVNGWFRSNQSGRGAVALMMNSTFIKKLMLSTPMVNRLQVSEPRRSKGIDGIISKTAKKVGFIEYCHYPSLVQHVGEESVQDNTWKEPSHCFFPEINAGDLLC